MSAIVCGKRSSSVFDELLVLSPPPSSKRIRCFGGEGSLNLFAEQIAHLRSLFPQMDQQLLQQVLEGCGNDLDSAIKSLNDLCLESTQINLSAKPEAGSESNIGLSVDSVDGITNDGGNSIKNPHTSNALPKDGSEWVELLVREMMNASDMDDARARASSVLDVLEKSVVAQAGAEALQNLHKENSLIKEQVDVLLRENTVLKRAVAIQHDRQKEYDNKNQELQHLKQLVSQYQEQLRTLEVNNYALTMHLRQAQQSSSIPGRFHPDVF